jgi:hypothetical protein
VCTSSLPLAAPARADSAAPSGARTLGSGDGANGRSILRSGRGAAAATAKVGIFGKLTTLDAPLADHDRVEIYRPLIVDPKVARQRRVEKTRRAGSVEGRKWLHKDSR